MTFSDFQLDPAIQQAVVSAGFRQPSPVQQAAIPLILEGNDLIAQAQTGTGKTAAFGLPILSLIQPDEGVQALVIVPTRELATQVSDELYRFGKERHLRTATVYGGTAYGKQIERIASASVVVATPGRLLDLLKSKKITLSPRFVVLDEADEMLDMGFLEEIKRIFTYLPASRQTLMFSATMPPAIRRLSETILRDPQTVTITQSEHTNTSITQLYYVVQEHERDDALVRLIDYKTPSKCIVFCRTKKEVDRLANHLTSQGFKVASLHGDMEQKQREVTIRAFKQGQVDIFVATDVAARGLDVADVSHVFNYHLPFDSESYVHRIGRTGRGGKSGEAITLVTPGEFRAIRRIEKDVGTTIASQTIHTRRELQETKDNALLSQIAQTPITEEGIDLVRTLQHDLDIVAIAQLLASHLLNNTQVGGREQIGLSAADIRKLIERSRHQGNDAGRSKRHGHGGRNNRRRNGRRNDRKKQSR
jgi:ATP-dependent RNA helicase DeaD